MAITHTAMIRAKSIARVIRCAGGWLDWLLIVRTFSTCLSHVRLGQKPDRAGFKTVAISDAHTNQQPFRNL